MRRAIAKSTWAEIKTAYASGIGLREIARTMGIPEGAVLAHAKREGWTRQIQSAKTLAKREDTLNATPVEAVAMSIQKRGERHVERMAAFQNGLSITSKQRTVPKSSTQSIKSKNSTRLHTALSVWMIFRQAAISR